MAMFLKKFRSQRAKNHSKKGIFRLKKEKNPTIEPSITWTMSDDAASEQSSSPYNAKTLALGTLTQGTLVEVKDVIKNDSTEPNVTFTETEVMQHELNHMRQLVEKDSEISMYKKANKGLQEQFVKKWADLKEKYQYDLTEKNNELAQVQTELQATKGELAQISSVLIQTQHQLHEHTTLSSSWLPWLN
jgi:hypothetical protein